MPLLEKDKFIHAVLKEVKFKADHTAIEEELRNHIEDSYEGLLEEGLEELEALENAVNNMGHPEIIGKELNKVHSPFLGWLWLISKWTRRFTTFLILVFVVLPIFIVMFSEKPLSELDKEMIIEHLEVDYKAKIDDKVIKITDLVYDSKGELHIYFHSYNSRIWQPIGRSGGIGNVTDDAGNRYSSSGISTTNFITYGEVSLHDFDIQSDTINIGLGNYDRYFEIIIPLDWEDL